MNFLSGITFLSILLSGLVLLSSPAGAQSGLFVANDKHLSTASDAAYTVETRTAKYHVFSEKIKMTAHVGEIWKANGDVLYQTNNYGVTDLVKNADGSYAVKFTNPGEAVIRVYIRKNGEIYVQDFLFRVQENAGVYGSASGRAGSSPGSRAMVENGDIATFQEQVLRLVNMERAKAGARPLRLDGELTAGAKIRAEEISRHFSHTRPDGRSCYTVLRSLGRTAGENIAAGRATPEAVVDQWMHSPGHRANMLNKSFSTLGVGYFYKDNSEYKHYWVQIFRG